MARYRQHEKGVPSHRSVAGGIWPTRCIQSKSTQFSVCRQEAGQEVKQIDTRTDGAPIPTPHIAPLWMGVLLVRLWCRDERGAIDCRPQRRSGSLFFESLQRVSLLRVGDAQFGGVSPLTAGKLFALLLRLCVWICDVNY